MVEEKRMSASLRAAVAALLPATALLFGASAALASNTFAHKGSLTDAIGGTGRTEAIGGTGRTEAIGGTGRKTTIEAIGGTGRAEAIGGTGRTEAIGGTGRKTTIDAIGGTGRTEAIGGTGRTEPIGGTGRTEAIGGTGRTEAIGGTGRKTTIDAIGGTGRAGAIGGTGRTEAIGGTGRAEAAILLAGQLETVDVRKSTLTILGQSLRTTRARTVAVGENVAVFGRVNAAGEVVVTDVRPFADGYVPGASRVTITGKVTAIDTRRGVMTIGRQPVDFTALLAGSTPELAVGKVVTISGTQPVPGGIILASD
jgi:hypothetical protein